MLKALVMKELRETAWIALVGLLAHLAFVANCATCPIFPWSVNRYVDGIPFVDSSFLSTFCFVSIGLAVALGLRQTAFESRGGTWLFLLHRPVSMPRLLAAKLVVGGGLYLICGLIAILSYAAWAAAPGNHASPFRWWMTADSWKALGLITIVYLAAFLSGIRPAHWFGTRLLPLAAGGVLAALLVFPMFWPLLGIVAFLLVAACLIGLIHFTARTRDFS
jgi:hypothetical protein